MSSDRDRRKVYLTTKRFAQKHAKSRCDAPAFTAPLLACSAFDMFARPTQLRKGTVDKGVLRQALVQYGSSTATEAEIVKLIDSLPMSEGDTSNEFDYAKHISQYLS